MKKIYPHLPNTTAMKNSSIPTFLFLLFFGSLHAQTDDWATAYQQMEQFTQAGQWQEAFAQGQKALSLAEKQGQKTEAYCNTLNGLSIIFFSVGQFEDAFGLVKQEYALRQQFQPESDPKFLECMNNLGVMYHQYTAQTDSAAFFYHKVLEAREESLGKMHPDYLLSLQNLGNFYESIGDLGQGEEMMRQAVSIYEESGAYKESKNYLTVLNNLAGLLEKTGRFAEAEAIYQKSLRLNKQWFDGVNEQFALAMGNLGVLYRAAGQLTLAESCFLTSKKVYEQAGISMSMNYFIMLQSYGILLQELGRFDQGAQMLTMGLEGLQALLPPDHPFIAQLYQNISGLYYKNEQFKLAEEYGQEAIKQMVQTLGKDHPELVDMYVSLGSTYGLTGQYDKEEAMYRKAVALLEKTENPYQPLYFGAKIQLMNHYVKVANYQAAQAIEDSLRLSIQEHLPPLHDLQATFPYEQAKLAYRMGDYKRATGKVMEAQKRYYDRFQEFSPGLSSEERMAFLASRQRVTDMAMSMMERLSGSYPEAAGLMYESQIRFKGLLLKGTANMLALIRNNASEEVAGLFEEWQQVRREYAQLYRQHASLSESGLVEKLDALKQKANGLERELVLQSDAFAQSRLEETVRWQEVQRALRPGEAALEIIRYDVFDFDGKLAFTDSSRYLAVVIKAGDALPTWAMIGDAAKLEKSGFKAFRFSIDKQMETVDSYQTFWSPIEPLLDDVQILYLSTDGIYNQVSLAALRNPATGQYISDQIDIRLLTNTGVLVNRKGKSGQQQPLAKPSAVLIGNPAYLAMAAGSPVEEMQDEKIGVEKLEREKESADLAMNLSRGGFDFPPLPATGQEVANIGAFLTQQGWECQILTGESAAEATLKSLRQPTVLHIATHGFFQQDTVMNPNEFHEAMLNAGLALAGAQQSLQDTADITFAASKTEEDGLLTAYEVAGLALDQTQLTVLSACETGLGENLYREGVFGLQRAFLQAGAKSVLMSLWKVSDGPTRLLMEAFYRHWLTTVNTSQALKMAQQEIRKQYPHPFFWAGFVLMESAKALD